MLVKLTIANMLFEMTTVLWRDTDENKWILFRFDSLNFFFLGGGCYFLQHKMLVPWIDVYSLRKLQFCSILTGLVARFQIVP
jgi:hypothetical protein